MKTLLLCLLTVLGGINLQASDDEQQATQKYAAGLVVASLASAVMVGVFVAGAYGKSLATEYSLHTAVCEKRSPWTITLRVACGARERLDPSDKTALHRTLANITYYNSRTHRHCCTTNYDPAALHQLLDQHKKRRLQFGDTPSQALYDWALHVGLDKRAQDDKEKMKKGLTVHSPKLPQVFNNSDLEELSHYRYDNQDQLVCTSKSNALFKAKGSQ